MTKKPESYSDVESPVLVDVWWEWSVTKALVAATSIGLGAVAYGLGAHGVGQLLIVLGPMLYVLSPRVRGPIA